MQDQPSNFASPPPAPHSTALATATLILGILGLVFSLFLVGGLLGLIGLILGAVYLSRKRPPRAMAWWGVGLCIVSILATVGFGSLYYAGYKQFRSAMADLASSESSSLSEWEGVIAPDLTVTTLEGETLQLSELRGKRVILDFWATWCGPCVKEIPHFIQLINETSRDDLVIVGISEEDVSTLEPFIKKHGINYPIASASDLASPYGDVTSLPTTFFIDRNGVIQTVLTGYHDLESLRSHAITDDFEGTPLLEPTPVAASELPEREPQLQPVELWTKNNVSGEAICVGDWDSDGAMDILVATSSNSLLVYSPDGTEKKTIPLTESLTMIEAGRFNGEFRLLGFSNWGKQVVVVDKNGKQLWTYDSTFGVNGAHWGDLDGDGNDEMVVGMNGFGGLHAVSPAGKRLWKVSLGNVWNQAIVPAHNNQPAYVFATEAGGTVRVFDAKGKPVKTLRPNQYSSSMTAARLDKDTVQGIVSDDKITAFDPTGKIQWSTSGDRNAGNWRANTFAVGDVDGDGTADWAFRDARGDLVLVTARGEKLATVTGKANASFALIPDASGKAILVFLNANTLEAYRFE